MAQWLQRVSQRAEERVGTLGTWRARGSYWSERKSSGTRGSPAMAMAGARCSRGTALQHGGEHKELGDKVSGSRRVRRCRRRGRGGSGCGESSDGDRRHRGWRRRPGRRCSASQVSWLGVDEEDDDAVLLDWSARRVVVGGRGYGERRRRRLSGGSGKRVRGGREGGPERERVLPGSPVDIRPSQPSRCCLLPLPVGRGEVARAHAEASTSCFAVAASWAFEPRHRDAQHLPPHSPKPSGASPLSHRAHSPPLLFLPLITERACRR